MKNNKVDMEYRIIHFVLLTLFIMVFLPSMVLLFGIVTNNLIISVIVSVIITGYSVYNIHVNEYIK